MTLRAIRSPLSALAFSTLLLLPFAAHAQEVAALTPMSDTDAVASVAAPDDDAASTATTAEPSVEWPLRRLACVPYARLRSGLAIFGDARVWWARARNIYDEFTAPAVDAVMVFAGSKRIRKGHVAVVAGIVSPREIIVDHANWQNHGEIDHNMPVLDVSAGNDWSQVRVWDVNTSRWGAHVYRISGFIGHDAKLAAAAGS
jgi:surface antigen